MGYFVCFRSDNFIPFELIATAITKTIIIVAIKQAKDLELRALYINLTPFAINLISSFTKSNEVDKEPLSSPFLFLPN